MYYSGFLIVQDAAVAEKSRFKEIHFRGGRFRPQRSGALRRAGESRPTLVEAVISGTKAHYRAEPCELSRQSVGGSTSNIIDSLV